jgi:hypothetical protein
VFEVSGDSFGNFYQARETHFNDARSDINLRGKKVILQNSLSS